MATETEQRWELKGRVLIACNCDYGCPCNFNALPTQGHCHGEWTWHVEAGSFDGVSLDGLTFTLAVKWPGAIHEGDGHAVLIVDERADEGQRDAIHRLVKGEAGGPWGVLGWTWPTLEGPVPAPYELELNGVRSRVRAGEYFELESEPIKNPVSGAEVSPSAVLPEGIIFKRGDFGSSRSLRVRNGISYEYSGKYTAVAPYEYAGP